MSGRHGGRVPGGGAREPGGRVIVVTGPPGAGKSTVAPALAGGFPRAVHLHADDFWRAIVAGAIPPHLPESDAQNHAVLDVVAGAAYGYAAAASSPWSTGSSARGCSTTCATRPAGRRKSRSTTSCCAPHARWRSPGPKPGRRPTRWSTRCRSSQCGTSSPTSALSSGTCSTPRTGRPRRRWTRCGRRSTADGFGGKAHRRRRASAHPFIARRPSVVWSRGGVAHKRDHPPTELRSARS